jgi:hypothetical protein
MTASTTITLDSARRKSRWWRTSLWLLLALCLLVALGAFEAVEHFEPALLQVSVDGTPFVTDLDLAALPPAHKVMLALGLALVLFVALFVVMGGIALTLVMLVPVVLLAVVLPLVVAGAVLLVLLSPLALLAWLLWRAVRPAARSTTMAA